MTAIFCVTQAGRGELALQTLYGFGANPKDPKSSLVQANDGNFYGTTESGGNIGDNGTVFRVTPSGVLTVLHSFGGADGALPNAGLVHGSDGFLYGTTRFGGTNGGFGTVFRITTTGQFTHLRSFDGTNGSSPQAALVQASDGNFYGTTASGGAGANGTVFRITPGNVFTLLFSFPSHGRSGRSPVARLFEGSDGNLYGTTALGGANADNGTVFRITTAGAFSIVFSFNGANGNGPAAGVVQGSDGNYYGTTEFGGATDNGTIFRVTANGALITMYSFSGPDGNFPRAALTPRSDGNFYGTTSGDRAFGGTNTFGTTFRITPRGALATLARFDGTNGATPVADLSLASDGNLYGTTFEGGLGGGTVFRLVEPPAFTAISAVGESVLLTWSSFPAGYLLRRVRTGADSGKLDAVGSGCHGDNHSDIDHGHPWRRNGALL